MSVIYPTSYVHAVDVKAMGLSARAPMYASNDSPIELFISSMLFGILSILVIAALVIIGKGSVSRISSRVYFPCILLLYISTGVYMSALVWNAVTTRPLASPGEISMDAVYQQDGVSAPSGRDSSIKSWMASISLSMNVMVGDSVVWWRTCMIWPNRLVYAFGLAILLANLVLTVVASCKSSEHAEKLSFMYSGDPYSSVSGALCVLLNVVATALIACKAWMHRRFLRKYLGDGKFRSRALKALVLVVESGVIYSMLLVFVVFYETGPLSYHADNNQAFSGVASGITYGCFVPAIAIYPTIIVVLAHYRLHPADGRLSRADQHVAFELAEHVSDEISASPQCPIDSTAVQPEVYIVDVMRRVSLEGHMRSSIHSHRKSAMMEAHKDVGAVDLPVELRPAFLGV